MQSLMGEMAGEILEHAQIHGTDTIGLVMPASTDAWIPEHAIESRLKGAGHTVVASSRAAGHSRYILSVDGAEMHVRYDDMFRKGIFGTRLVRRTLSADLSSRMLDGLTGVVLYGGALARVWSDTVAIDDIGALELAGAPSTRGEIPEGGLLDRFIEPFVIIGTTGVAVYLFFHLRS